MNNENTLKLKQDFPKLYGGCDDKISLMRFGFAHQDGWFALIYELSEKLSKMDPKLEAIQVKEKFGGLRFYTGKTSKEVLDLICEYENKSYKICERCGTTEDVKLRGGNWLHTFCDKCDNEYKKEQVERWDSKS